MSWIVIAVVAVLVLVGASALAGYLHRRFAEKARGQPTYAFDRAESSTSLDHRVDELSKDRASASGLIMLSSNLDAFAARAHLARSAGRSLDLMYYVWENDLTGRLLAGEIIAAADRGVRVRLLLDDVGVFGFDATYLAFAEHPKIELRLFNPTRFRNNLVARGIEMALRAFSVTRRMHNKAWIADGRLAIVGGRNVADEYFDAGQASYFRDLDLLMLGPVVRDAEDVFDAYWNSGLALPIGALAARARRSLDKVRHVFRTLKSSNRARPYIDRLHERVCPESLLDPRAIHWTETAKIVSDPPEKAVGKKGKNWLMAKLLPVMTSATQALEIQSPYFIPGNEGVDRLVSLVKSGVSVRVLTNSLSATDVAAVHGGYAPYRQPLLKGGVRLFELKRSGSAKDLSLRGSSQASLHTKAFTVDDRIGFIGSLNLDPRSMSLNTEMGVLFEVPELVATMRSLFEEEIAPQKSYTLSLAEDGSLKWTADENGQVKHFDHEPEASLTRRLIARIVGFLPLESQL